MIILIHPPVVKPCEPPAGLAKLAGTLKKHGVKYLIVDANLEGILNLLKNQQSPIDTWSKRACRNITGNLATLKNLDSYRHLDRYKRAVRDLNRVLTLSSCSGHIRLGLSNYQDKHLSPLQSQDLIRAAELPENNPFYPYFEARMLRLLHREQPSIIGFSLNYLSQALCTFAMIGFLKKKCPESKIVLGGGLVTSWLKRLNGRNPFRGLVNEVVSGPGEVALLSILGKTPLEENDTPLYDDFPETKYMAPGFILPYSTASGCYWGKCAFCPEKAEGNSYQPIPIKQLYTDIQALTKKTKPLVIHLLNNAISLPVFQALADQPLKIPWYGFTRILKQLTDLEFCITLKRSGCVMLQLGLESGDQDVLNELNKGIDLATASSALKTLKKAGIFTYVYLLFGTPSETEAAARRTLDFIAHHHDQIDFLNLAIFNLPIGSSETEKLATRDFYEGDLSLYRNFEHPKGWNRSLVRQFLDKEFRRHPAVSSIMRNDPPIFTSNHAPFWAIASKDKFGQKFIPY
jgi:radical SAM superfamily enzyme YgiQ (UPF0313 family)